MLCFSLLACHFDENYIKDNNMSWKKNNRKDVYEWIVDLNNQGKSESEILNVFEQSRFKVDLTDEKQVAFAKSTIRHALGKATDSEKDALFPPSKIIGFSVYDECSEGYLFQAETPDIKDDFYFLVDKNAINDVSTIEDVYKLLNEYKERVCELLFFKVHTQHPFEVSCMPFECAKAKFTAQDFI
jgi:hypothetical protein